MAGCGCIPSSTVGCWLLDLGMVGGWWRAASQGRMRTHPARPAGPDAQTPAQPASQTGESEGSSAAPTPFPLHPYGRSANVAPRGAQGHWRRCLIGISDVQMREVASTPFPQNAPPGAVARASSPFRPCRELSRQAAKFHGRVWMHPVEYWDCVTARRRAGLDSTSPRLPSSYGFLR
jgi:hypothetical protein